MSATTYFYKDPSGREIGPLPLAALAQLRLTKVLGDETPVRASDSEEWKPCREIIAAPESESDPGQALQPEPRQASVPWSKYSWSLFVVVMLCFLLPFMAVSCQGKKLVEFTGFELVIGKNVSMQGTSANPTSSEAKRTMRRAM